MKSKNFFAYSMNSRVIWVSDEVFHVPVLNDLYRIHLVENFSDVNTAKCYDYTVKHFHKFVQTELVHNPLQAAQAEEVMINHEKMQCFIKLRDFVNFSYQAALPPVFGSETDKLEILAKSLINESQVGVGEVTKHHEFVNQLFQDKKSELSKRYIDLVHQLKSCRTLEEVKNVGYSIVYEAINVV